MSQGIIAIVISLLATWLAVRAFAKSKHYEYLFIDLCKALHADIKELEDMEMAAEDKIKKIEEIIKWTDESLKFNEVKGQEEEQIKAFGYNKIREIIKEN